ncbi:MAG TPA: hypothetical protein VGV64_00675, partial [Thermoplasmata archaeon]|nr:hypothetical protein [Thermoplasmata archaeon]
HNSATFSPLKSGYLGNLNIPVFEMGNAWLNGNLSLDPYYDVNNGTSYWGNHGASLQYSWPPGQNFPTASNGASVYGDTVPGWDFPTGWGSINVYNFAQDMLQMANEEAFMTVNATSNTWAPSEWGSMTLNQTYTIDVNATTTLGASNPTVIVEYFPQGGSEQRIPFRGASLNFVAGPGTTPGLRFSLDTSAAPFAPSFSPGLIILTLGNASNRNIGFGFGWVGPSIAPGPLTVTVQNPGGGSIVGGCASANVDWPLGSLFPGVQNSGLSCATYTLNGGDSRTPFATLYQNTFTVRVTNSLGQGVYNAMVTAQVPSIRDLAWVGSMAECQTTWYCRSSSLMPTIISETFTNLTGYALVETSNMAFPTPYFVNATYGPESGGTTYLVTPAPNIQPIGPDSGKYAVFNPVDLELWIYHQNPSNQTLQNWVPNYLNTSSLYTSLYGWQGETLRLHISNSTGAPLGGRKVWLGTYDTGREYKFQRYIGTAGMLGVTNSSPILGNDTWGYTDGSGDVSINIPDNMSASNFWGYLAPAPMGVASISVDTPGVANNTFQYIEKCAPLNFSNPSPLINCEFNNSYQRNYTSTPLWILPNPVHVVSMTTAHVDRDFFGSGANISLRVNVSLPTQNPIEDWYFLPNGYDGNPGQWSSGLEHVTGMNVYVDNQFVENVTPEEPPQIQGWAQFNNLTGNYTPGIHELTVRVTTSLGQIFTNTHRFIVGSIVNENLGIKNLYLPVPYLLNWSINIPASEVSNVTFNSSLQIVYVPPSGGCFFALACQVVNYSVKVHPHQVNFNQSINTTLLNKNGFYSGAGGLPPGQYNVIIWFSANHSGSIRQSYTPYLVFDPLSGQITGPTSGAQVPLGNVTLAYTYQGGYVTNATLEVWQENANGTSQLVYTQLAFIPANGGESRSGSVTWTAVSTGTYTIDLVLGAPYGTYNATEKIFVQNLNPPVFINKTNGQLPLFNLNPVAVSTLLALVAGIVGILLGLWVAPVLRPTAAGPGAAAPAKAWEEGKTDSKSASAVKNECSICHERFETPDGLHQHQKVVHGIEE